ncbi:MAG: glycogen debranching protein GlgX [Beutenbergiaceae bacterium]
MTSTDTTATVTVLEITQATEPATAPHRFGVHLTDDGVDVVVSAAHADGVWLCLLDDADGVLTERRIGLLPRTHGRWHAHIPGIGAGQCYGLRVDGPWDPARGMRHNPNKLLLDPYARGLSGQPQVRPEIYAHAVNSDLEPEPDVDGPDGTDSAPFVAHGVILEDPPGGGTGNRPRITWSRTVIYEAHVRGLTMRLAGVPEHLRGSYAGLAHPATIEHLRTLGVTSLQLLPIHAKFSEPSLTRRGKVNYWGYNTLSYFAPEPSYATQAAQQAGPAAVLEELKGMVQLLHDAGIEVLLDVVYNHTCEAGPDGPCLSLRGLDDAGYYLHDGGPAAYLDVTGCGNSLDFRNHRAIQLTLDSLRYWVQQVGIDGFRFDLATTLARRGRQVDMQHPLLVALATDPILSGTKLIVEPWDLGPDGWQTGRYPPPISEWNDRYRDAVRTFWLTDAAAIARGEPGHDLREIATRLAGSADLFAHTDTPGGRGPVASINFITAHDGFTLADLTGYDHKHNLANGEDNRDGTDNNRSWNHGIEGVTDDPAVAGARRRAMRNLLGTLFVSAGVPMLTAGDELARTQYGNNNAYCQDDESVWVDWDLDEHQHHQLATVQHLSRLRREHVALRPWRFRRPEELTSGEPTLVWFDEDGEPMSTGIWHDPHRRVVQMYRRSLEPGGRDVLVVVNGAANDVEVKIPSIDSFELVWDSVWEAPQAPSIAERTGRTVIGGPSLRIYLSEPAGPR